MTKRLTKPAKQAAPKKPNKTRCQRGHLLSGENLQITSNGGRYCRICHRAAILAAVSRAQLGRRDSKEVAPGQIWRSLRKRNRGQPVRILGIIGQSAIVKPLLHPGRPIAAHWFLVKLTHFHPVGRGYKLVHT
jgi:hypothetical protein